MTFEELEHTADVLVRVRAASINELFADAARALFSVMYGPCRDAGIVQRLTVEAGDPESLLHDFLSELLFIADVENVVLCRFELDVGEGSLSAVMHGEPFDPAKHAGGTIIKGISYSGLRIVKDDETYGVDVLFDV
ncbi:hypothetical protein ABH15_08270 [Methanoculleus taiwanensis]|uniref:Archease domain-containing protein n=1 Tax=Methanoculleus taiwanensis TaxID=1550565 RepID=A0A498H2G2_9EURY|nr:archease [Methanoculleus taiwanensis]RXE56146.1 hypothetical protein ABH15_08270 [Methanoculleus taiwanensis]